MGRKKLDDAKTRFNIRAKSAHIKKCTELGGGNMSKGAEILFSFALENEELLSVYHAKILKKETRRKNNGNSR